MSHFVTIETIIHDLAALEMACSELGLIFNKGNTDFHHPTENLVPREACSHTISTEDSAFAIGLSEDRRSGSYQLLLPSGRASKAIEGLLGKGCKKLVQTYGIMKTTLEAKKRGFDAVRENQPDGSVKVFITKSV